MLIEEELKGLLNTEIAITMSDGQAYRGYLHRFDADVMVLENVYETSTQEVDWVESKESRGQTSIKGYVPWRRITLPKLIVRVPMVLRIWPWSSRDVTEGSADTDTAAAMRKKSKPTPKKRAT